MSESAGKPPEKNADRWFIELADGTRGVYSVSALLHQLMDQKIKLNALSSNDGKSWVPIFKQKSIVSRVEQILSGLNLQESGNLDSIESSLNQLSELDDIGSFNSAVDDMSRQLQDAQRLADRADKVKRLTYLQSEIHNLQKGDGRIAPSAQTGDPSKSGPIQTGRNPRLITAESNPGEVGHLQNLALKVSILEKIPIKLRWAIGLTVLGLVLGGTKLILYELKLQREATERDLLRDTAYRAKASGVNQEIIASYLKLAERANLTPEQKFDLAMAMIKTGNSEKGQRDLQAVVQDVKTEPKLTAGQLAQAHLMLGHLLSRTNQTQLALLEYESALQKPEALDKESQVKALNNQAVLLLREGRAGTSELLFLKALPIAFELAEPTLKEREEQETLGHPIKAGALEHLIAIIAGLYHSTIVQDRFERIGEEAASVSAQSPFVAGITANHQHVVKFLTTLNQYALPLLDSQRIDGWQRKYLLTLISLTQWRVKNDEDFKANLSKILARGDQGNKNLNWSDFRSDYLATSLIFPHCSHVFESDKNSSIGAAFFASCVAITHGPKQALPYAQFAAAKEIKDLNLLGLYAELLLNAKDDVSAAAVLLPRLSHIDPISPSAVRTAKSICMTNPQLLNNSQPKDFCAKFPRSPASQNDQSHPTQPANILEKVQKSGQPSDKGAR